MYSDTPPWTLDPDDPRAPSAATWAAMSDDQRRRAIASLPSTVPPESIGMVPEGDPHSAPANSVQESLQRYYKRTGRAAYVGRDLLVYYPDERVFAPDVFVALDVGSHPRMSWSVQAEGKGLDVAFEVLLTGSRQKDLEFNVARYARLGIPEYFVFEPLKKRLHGFRQPKPGAPYDRIVPQFGRCRCEVLGLDLVVVDDRVRLYYGEMKLPIGEEVEAAFAEQVERLFAQFQDESQRAEAESQRAEAESQRAEAESQRADEEHRRRLDAEAALAEALKRLSELESE